MATPAQPFTVTLTSLEEYSPGTNVEVKVTITNNHPHDYYLLKYDTPLEDLSSDIFHITCRNELLPYDGILLKRGYPSQEAYVEIKAQSAKLVTVNLTDAYAFNDSEVHTVQLETSFQYYKKRGGFLEQSIVSNKISFSVLSNPDSELRLTKGAKARKQVAPPLCAKMPESEIQAPIPPCLHGDSGNDTDQLELNEAYNHAFNCVGKLSLSKNFTTGTLKRWFGESEPGTYIEKIFSNLTSAMEFCPFKFKVDKDPMHKDMYAYTHHGSDTIWLCPLYFLANLTGDDSKMGIIIHELTHAVAYTDDVIVNGKKMYGHKRCKELAKQRPDLALKNADNYEYFAECNYN